MRICRKCGRPNVATTVGLATCVECQPRRNTRYRLRSHHRSNTPRGENHGRAQLEAGDVMEIRRRRDAGETTTALAAEFGVTSSTISQIGRRLIWQHIDEVAVD